jgi:large subunit ribosomal protein L28
MSRICDITGAKPIRGNKIHRRGLAKKKGGIGQHVTAITPRYFQPNLKTKRIWVTELKRFVTVKLTCRAMKTINKNGAYSTLKKAGILA